MTYCVPQPKSAQSRLQFKSYTAKLPPFISAASQPNPGARFFEIADDSSGKIVAISSWATACRPRRFWYSGAMQKLPGAENTVAAERTGRCLGCFRPQRDCYCVAIPTIDNQTEILILQHRRERFHPFNTARMVRRALRNASLVSDHIPGLAARLAIGPRAGLLYPGPGAELLANVPADQRPRQLIVIDGTWHQAKTLVRDIPALQDIPRYQITPQEPSRYRIRREPSAMLLSTVEATVAALRLLEPATRGLDQLLDAFHTMVERQLAQPKSDQGWRRNAARTRHGRNIPAALLSNLENIVVAYGESVRHSNSFEVTAQVPIYWTAQRMGSGERFACHIQPPFPLQDSVLRHLDLTANHFVEAIPLVDARAMWQEFWRPSDILALFSHGTARLFAQLGGQTAKCLVLKAVDFNPQRRYSTLDDLVAAERLTVAPAWAAGRAGKRLANAVALVERLRTLKDRQARQQALGAANALG
jgi:DTW domain-containing protein YfiP